MTRIYFILLIVICTNFLNAQKANTKGWSAADQKIFTKAEALFENKNYAGAFEKYKALLANHATDLYLKYNLAICGVDLSDKHQEALAYLDDVHAANPKTANINFYYAILFHKTYQFDKALELINALMADAKTTPEQKTYLLRLTNYCKNGKTLVDNPVAAKIENLGTPLNSAASEYAPVITSDEETMIFTYRGKESMGGLVDETNKADPEGNYNEDIFISKKVDGKWSAPEGIKELNTLDNDAVIAISNDGQQLFIFKETKTDGGDIYVSKLVNGKWEKAEKLKGEVNTNSWEGSVSMSGDSRKLFFASERPGGLGGKDIYMATLKTDGTWGNVTNLGNKINTPLDEDAPFIHPDGRSIVFSSEGHNSIGDFDIFIADYDEATKMWKDPTNVGYPVNTTDDDLCYVLSADGKRGYYSSAKKDGNGDQDIYMVDPGIMSKQSHVTIIKGTITELLSPIECEINVKINGEDGRSYGTYRSNPVNGHYLVNLPSGFNYKLSYYHPILGDKVFDIVAEKVEGYAEKIININFGMNDTSATNHQTVVMNDAGNSQSVTPAPKVMNYAELVDKLGSTVIPDLKYYVQVAASKNPAKYNKKPLAKLCKVKQEGMVNDEVHLLIADKEFDNLKATDTFLKEARTIQSDAFITTVYKGKRCYLSDLTRMGVFAAAVK
jgi:hypothetical protein